MFFNNLSIQPLLAFIFQSVTIQIFSFFFFSLLKQIFPALFLLSSLFSIFYYYFHSSCPILTPLLNPSSFGTHTEICEKKEKDSLQMTHNSPQGRLKCYLTTPIVELSLETAHRYLHTFIDKLCKVPLSYICTLILYHSSFFTPTGFLSSFFFFFLSLCLFFFCSINSEIFQTSLCFFIFVFISFQLPFLFLSISFLFRNLFLFSSFLFVSKNFIRTANDFSLYFSFPFSAFSF